jgi:hypothetical protein
VLSSLSEDGEVARRIAFVMAKLGSKLGLPAASGAEALLQGAMERPEAVTPEAFKVAYALLAAEPIPANPISSIAR